MAIAARCVDPSPIFPSQTCFFVFAAAPLCPKSNTINQVAGEGTGIISSAIANAAAKVDKLPSQHGQENISLLQQQQLQLQQQAQAQQQQQQHSAKASPASSQFTFTCSSQVPGNLAWPAPSTPMHQQTHSTQTQWHQGRNRGDYSSQAPQANTTAPLPPVTATAPMDTGVNPTNPPAQTGKKKSRGRLNKELDAQARARKREQELWNYANPPQDDIYICAFCEFESINGYKPMTLIRAFEMKERKKRLEAERRQRLLEKAKARGRKGKKGKPPAKNSVPENQAQAGQQGPPMQANQS